MQFKSFILKTILIVLLIPVGCATQKTRPYIDGKLLDKPGIDLSKVQTLSFPKVKEIITLFKKHALPVQTLQEFIHMDVFWDNIKTITKIQKKQDVYDITVPGANNFIANTIIVHNSTAMNMIGCLDVPTRGSVFLDGKDIATMRESDLAQIRGRKIGFIFQQFNLINTLSALENVTLPMIFQNKSTEERVERAKELLKLVELEGRTDHRPTELSGGQQQRVAIARSLSNNPDIILADEPTGNLDSKTGTNVMDFLKKLHKEQGKTIIMVTHDERTAMHADRVEYLKDGQIIKR